MADSINEEYLQLLYELDKDGFPIGEALRGKVKNWLTPSVYVEQKPKKFVADEIFITDTTIDFEADVAVLPEGSEQDISKIKDINKFLYIQDGDINTSLWKIPMAAPLSERYNDEFVAWIDSINADFRKQIEYKRFELYKRQAEIWLNEKKGYEDCLGEDARMKYILREIQRCNDNGYYFLDKYWSFKDSASPTGFTKYSSGKAHKIWAFLIDSGYDLIGGKGRQIWFTTTTFGLAVRDALLNYSTFIKIITADIDKAVDTLEEKARAPLYEMADFMKPTKLSGDGKMYLEFHRDKKEQKGGGSSIKIDNPTETAINSGNPKRTYIDEAGLIEIIFPMIENWKSTADQYNPVTKKLEKKGQLIAWGTSDKKNIPEFEHILRDCMKRWQDKKYRGLMMPIFFNVFAREGVTDEYYNELYESAYAVEGINRDESIRQFRQANPITIEDMFLSSAETIIPLVEIQAGINRCENAPTEHKCRFGYFEPIFDQSKPTNSEFKDFPYKIIGAHFVPVDDEHSSLVTTCIYREPQKNWKWRYYKGTDPITATTGKSDFATSIWDALTDEVSATMSMRTGNNRDSFLQSLLLHLYYGGIYVKDLVEINIGQAYVDFVTDNGLEKTLVYNVELPAIYQITSGSLVGFNKRGSNIPRYLPNDLVKILQLYRDNIWIGKFWVQLKTFTKKKSVNGVDVFAPENIDFHKDDVIDSVLYSWICRQSYLHKNPICTELKKEGIVTKLVYGYDEGWNLVLKPQPVKR